MAEKWIQKAHIQKGALHRELGIAEGKKIPKATLEKAATKGGVEGRRARLAETLEGLHKGKGKEMAKKEKEMPKEKGKEKMKEKMREMAKCKKHDKKHDCFGK